MTVPADDTTPLIEAAHDWYDAGFCVIPSHEDGSKRPFGAWKKYQQQRPDWDALRAWLITGRYTGIGLIMGEASGNTEMIEIEGPEKEMGLRLNAVIEHAKTYNDAHLDALLHRVLLGYLEVSAGGGLHTIIRITDGPALGNTKLAHEGDKVIAETRGEGGFVIVWPTPARTGHDPAAAYVLEQGKPSTVVEVTSDERDMLHQVFQFALDNPAPETVTAPKPAPIARTVSTVDSSDVSPFDDFTERVTWQEILEPAGWTLGRTDFDGRQHWTRPGKDPRDGESANIKDGVLFIHSSSVTDLPREVGLNKVQTYAHLHHGGDLSATARALRDRGYGTATYVLPSWSPEATLQADFYDQHATLASIRQAAHARLVSADAVLACVLARVAQHIPWEYSLPPIIGGKSSPNLYVALIGPSGTGKGGARRAADELLNITQSHKRPTNEGPLGSGEGIVSLFYGQRPADPTEEGSKPGKTLEFMYRNVMILDEEGSGLADLLKRQGQLTEPTLLKMWSGENLGMSYSARSTAVQLKVPGDQYRASALLGIQPAAAAFLLEDARSDKGLPQRFLWASTIEPDLPEEELGFPALLNWQPPSFKQTLDGMVVEVDPSIRKQLRHAQIQRVRGAGNLGLDSHSGLVQLKAATALAALLRPGEPLVVDLATWELAAQLKEASDKVRISVARQAQAERDKVSQARQDVAIRQRIAVQEVDARVQNCARRLANHINNRHAEDGEYCTKSCARRSITSQYRDVFDAALEQAMNLDWVVDVSTEDAEIAHYRAGQSRPA